MALEFYRDPKWDRKRVGGGLKALNAASKHRINEHRTKI